MALDPNTNQDYKAIIIISSRILNIENAQLSPFSCSTGLHVLLYYRKISRHGNFANLDHRQFRDRTGLTCGERLGPLLYNDNIRVQENFTNLAIFVKFTKISCTQIFPVIQYRHKQKGDDNREGMCTFTIQSKVEALSGYDQFHIRFFKGKARMVCISNLFLLNFSPHVGVAFKCLLTLNGISRAYHNIRIKIALSLDQKLKFNVDFGRD